MRRQDHRKRLLHHEEVGYPSVPNQVAVEMEVEVSLVGDGGLHKGDSGERSI
jgi:hypothetical protein